MIKRNCINLGVRSAGHGEGEYVCKIRMLSPIHDCELCLSYKDKYENSQSEEIIKRMKEIPMKP
jgi:hypothetical protein